MKRKRSKAKTVAKKSSAVARLDRENLETDLRQLERATRYVLAGISQLSTPVSDDALSSFMRALVEIDGVRWSLEHTVGINATPGEL